LIEDLPARFHFAWIDVMFGGVERKVLISLLEADRFDRCRY
jgi:uncharacterized membrane protein